ncbi:MAG: hypothetical protein ABJF01_17615 [bacterium]
MRMRHAALALLVLAAARIEAQNGPTQDSTLIGVRLVQLNLVSTVDERRGLRESMALELRKAGLRVLPDSARLGTAVDAIITVVLREPAGCAKDLRMNVAQRVQVVRTARVHQLVTWLYEVPVGGVRGGNACRDEWWNDAIRQATDVFLTKWLDVNGR